MTRKALSNKSLRSSIQTRMILTIILTATVILAGFALSDYFITSARMKRDFDDLAEYIANQQSKSLALPLWYLDKEAIEGVIYSAMTEKQVYAIHVREETDIVYGKIRDDNWNIVEISKDFSSDYYSKSKEIFHNNDKLGVVEVFLTPKFMQEKLDGVTVGMLMAIIILNISLVTILFISIRKSIIIPVSRVAEGVRFIASGDLDRSIHSKRKDEIGQLASNVDSMRLAIKENLDLVREKNKTLQIEISERKRADEALRESEKNLSITLNSIGDAVIATDAEGCVIRMNPVAEKLTGWSLSEAEGRAVIEVFNIINEKTRQRVESPVEKVMREGVIVGLANHTVLISKNGPEFPIADSGAPIRNDQGDIVGVVLVFRDVSEKRKAEAALRDSEKKYRDLYDTAPDMFVSVDAKTANIIECNQTLANTLDYTKEEIIGRPIFDVYAPDSAKRAKEILFPLFIKIGSIHEEELQLQRKDGSKLYVSLNTSAVRDDKGNILHSISVWRNITNRKQAEKEKQKLEIHLQRAQKMEAIGTLSGGIAHDFNNMLFPIIGFAEMMLDDIPENSPLRNSINEILIGAKRAGDLVKQILAFSRQADQELKPLKVHLIVKEVLKLSRSTLPSTIEIIQDISNDCSLVMADSTQIHQIAMNLIINAYHAMQETGGKLEVTLKEVELGIDDLRDRNMYPGPYACLTIADTGIGMEKDVLNRIFDPYFTTKGKDQGTGLGLAVVHGIIKSYGGDIKVYSEPGKGTVFHVYLPVVKTEVESVEAKAASQIEKGDERILLVDDEDQIVRLVKQMLERLGYHVTVRTSSTDALEAFRAEPDKFDLIITDMTMPNMTGVQLTQKLLVIRPDMPIIICSGFSEQIDDEKAKAMGISGYVMKPIVRSELAKKIREAIDREI